MLGKVLYVRIQVQVRIQALYKCSNTSQDQSSSEPPSNGRTSHIKVTLLREKAGIKWLN